MDFVLSWTQNKLEANTTLRYWCTVTAEVEIFVGYVIGTNAGRILSTRERFKVAWNVNERGLESRRDFCRLIYFPALNGNVVCYQGKGLQSNDNAQIVNETPFIGPW